MSAASGKNTACRLRDVILSLYLGEIYQPSSGLLKKNHEQTEASPTEGHKDDEGAAAFFI